MGSTLEGQFDLPLRGLQGGFPALSDLYLPSEQFARRNV
jgi:hypothetical protein